MRKKLVCLISLVLGLWLVNTSAASTTNPALVGWWKFDEGSGNIAVDSSGNCSDAWLYGDPNWVTGYIAGALEFDSDGDSVNCGWDEVLDINDAITVAVWIKVNTFDASWQTIVSRYQSWSFRRDTGAPYHGKTRIDSVGFFTQNSGCGEIFGTTPIDDGQWHHVAATYDSTTGKQYLYIDGIAEDSSQGNVGGSMDIEAGEKLCIGATSVGHATEWNGLIDDVRIYNRALSQGEILSLAARTAGNPSPFNGVPNAPNDVILSWSPGKDANSHDVYFGTSLSDVTDANTSNHLGVYKGNQPVGANSYDPGALELDVTYYWRIDEVNYLCDPCIWTGSVWSFATRSDPALYLIAHWKFEEGTGSTTYDSSGNATPADGTLYGDPQWVAGKVGNYALDFDGIGDFVNCAIPDKLKITNAITFALWVKVDSWSTQWTSIAGRYHPYFIRRGQSGNTHSANWRTDGTSGGSTAGMSMPGTSNIDDGEWHHVAGTYDGATGKQYIYIDGALENSAQGDVGGSIRTGDANPFIIAAHSASGTQSLDGQIDDVSIYNRALLKEEIERLVLENEGLTIARNPSPADKAYALKDTKLGWSAGCYADSHNVYFGTDFNDVDDATPICQAGDVDGNCQVNFNDVLVLTEQWLQNPPGGSEPSADLNDDGKVNLVDLAIMANYWMGCTIFRGSRDSNSYDPGELELYQTYYWRIDEVDALKTYKGNVWSFYIPDTVELTVDINGISGEPDIVHPNAGTHTVPEGGTIQLIANTSPNCQISPEPSTVLFTDDFEGDLSKWSTYDNWDISTDRYQSGTHSVRADLDSGNLTSDSVDASGYSRMTIAFKYYIIGIDDDDEVIIQFYDGSNYVNIKEIGDDDENTWLTFSKTVYNAVPNADYFNDSFSININGGSIDSNEYLYIDDVSIEAYTYKMGFDHWDVNSSQTSDDPNSPTINVVVDSNMTVTAFYKPVLLPSTCFDANPPAGPVGGGRGYSRLVYDYDYLVSTKSALLTALGTAVSGEVIYVDDNAEIDMTGEGNMAIPGGVTLAGGRGKSGSKGALLYTDQFATSPFFLIGGENVRITGLRLRGPDPEVREQAYDPNFPLSSCIKTSHPYLEIDNCEISAWSYAGILLRSAGPNAANIHHNYIHHVQRIGLGYGVCHWGSESLIEANVFDWCRHSIAGSGIPEDSYEARYNLVLENAFSHSFDMHGGWCRQDGTDIAGDWIYIHNNVFLSTRSTTGHSNTAVVIRGIPLTGAFIYRNWFLHSNIDSAARQRFHFGHFHAYDNQVGPDRAEAAEIHH